MLCHSVCRKISVQGEWAFGYYKCFFAPVGKGGTKISTGLGKMRCKQEPLMGSMYHRGLDPVQGMGGQVKQRTVAETVGRCCKRRCNKTAKQLLVHLF